jgi:hypothetical protein
VRTPTENQSELWLKTRQARERISGFYQLFSSSSCCEQNAANLLAAASEWIFFWFSVSGFAVVFAAFELFEFVSQHKP